MEFVEPCKLSSPETGELATLEVACFSGKFGKGTTEAGLCRARRAGLFKLAPAAVVGAFFLIEVLALLIRVVARGASPDNRIGVRSCEGEETCDSAASISCLLKVGFLVR